MTTTELPAFTSNTMQRVDAVATECGWTRHQDRLGMFIEYRRNTLYVSLYLNIRGGIISATTNRRGGRNAIGTGKAAQVTEWLSSVTR